MASTIISSLKYFIIVLVCAVYVVQAQRQQVTLYSNFNQVGQNLTIVANKVSRLFLYSFSDIAWSACVTGTWLLYDGGFYNQGATNLPVEYYFGNNKCVNLQNVNRIASLRYVGSPNDYKESSITLYSGVNFQREEAYIDRDLPSLMWNGKSVSFIVTGRDSWTLYDQPNYKGNFYCVIPPTSDQPLFITDTNSLNIPHTLFQSVKKGGCGTKDDMNNSAATATRGWNLLPTISAPSILLMLIRRFVQFN